MSLEHLEGKRKGRPKGAKSSPPWVRDLLWAYHHLDKPDAEPRSEMARLLLALGREHPDRLINCLLTLEAQGTKSEEENLAPDSVSRSETNGFPKDDDSRRVKGVTISEPAFFEYLRAEPGKSYVFDLPSDARVVGCKPDIPNRSIDLVVRSMTFPEVPDGKPIPELEREQAR
jgi:hypothetical protein